jgi:glyoxylase-like metal-dependent hydrolase (beta-lactamase superfamily II)
MAGCTIIPIPTFHRDHELSGILFRTDIKRDCTIGGYAWFIADGTQKILVDTGGSVDYIRGVKNNPCEEGIDLEQGLARLGFDCDSIDLVIFTHLHHDHTAQARRIPRAKFLAQKDEIEFALNPHPFYANAYPRQFVEGLRFEAIFGDLRISENVSIVRTPGHTVGGQSVAVKTEKGLAVISGICSIQENFEPSMVGSSLPLIPPTPHVDVLQALESMEKIKNMADILIPNHEPRYLTISQIP